MQNQFFFSSACCGSIWSITLMRGVKKWETRTSCALMDLLATLWLITWPCFTYSVKMGAVGNVLGAFALLLYWNISLWMLALQQSWSGSCLCYCCLLLQYLVAGVNSSNHRQIWRVWYPFEKPCSVPELVVGGTERSITSESTILSTSHFLTKFPALLVYLVSWCWDFRHFSNSSHAASQSWISWSVKISCAFFVRNMESTILALSNHFCHTYMRRL